MTLWVNINNHHLNVSTETEPINHANRHPDKLTFKNKLTGLPALTKLTASMQRRKYTITIIITTVSEAGMRGTDHLELCALIGQSGISPGALLPSELHQNQLLGPEISPKLVFGYVTDAC